MSRRSDEHESDWLGVSMSLGLRSIGLRLIVSMGLGHGLTPWLLWLLGLLAIESSSHLVDHAGTLVDGIGVLLALLATVVLSGGHLSHWRHLVGEVGSAGEALLEALGEVAEEIKVLEASSLLSLMGVGECIHAMGELVGHISGLGEGLGELLGVLATVLGSHLGDLRSHGLGHLGTLSEAVGEVAEVETQFLELRLVVLHLELLEDI